MSEEVVVHPDVLRIQNFAEKMAEHFDGEVARGREYLDNPQIDTMRARAEAFWVVRNYIEDLFVQFPESKDERDDGF